MCSAYSIHTRVRNVCIYIYNVCILSVSCITAREKAARGPDLWGPKLYLDHRRSNVVGFPNKRQLLRTVAGSLIESWMPMTCYPTRGSSTDARFLAVSCRVASKWPEALRVFLFCVASSCRGHGRSTSPCSLVPSNDLRHRTCS